MRVRKICLFKQRQKGVILIITLVLMVVIALGAVASIRMSGVDEMVNNNTRSRITAMQAANAAIVDCRQRVFRSAQDMKVQTGGGGMTDEGTQWESIDNWKTSAGKINSVENGFSTYTANIRPQCMIEDITEFMAANSTNDNNVNQIVAYRITARGFSPNFQENGDGIQVRGSQAWQQVIVGRTIAVNSKQE